MYIHIYIYIYTYTYIAEDCRPALEGLLGLGPPRFWSPLRHVDSSLVEAWRADRPTNPPDP